MKSLLFSVLSAGWLFPLYLSGSFYLEWLDVEVSPRFYGQTPMNSFPFLHFSQQAFEIGVCWLALVIVGWAFVILEHLKKTSLGIAR